MHRSSNDELVDISVGHDIVRLVPSDSNTDFPCTIFPKDAELVCYHYIKVWEVNEQGERQVGT